jgi:5-deoxy-5-amino-3-dehydroquinate synthase
MKVTVELEERSYDVVVEDGARHRLGALIADRAPQAKNVVVVTSASLARESWFDVDSGREQTVLLVPEGESAKTLRSLEELLEALAQRRLSRDDVIVGVGGGAVSDLAGFAAATYLRGVALVQIPTSLVGQVDAAIGGKTGVNLAAGKNLVGAFYQPLGVLCDTGVLSTLPEREQKSGLGEIAKCWLLEGRRAEELSSTSLASLVELSVRLKAQVVSGDEREGGSRVLLNYGHTLAHALEKLALKESPDALRHGEAVAIGLAFAVRLAKQLGLVGEEEVANHDAVLNELKLAARVPRRFDTEELLDAMTHDKKAHHDLSFVLPGPSGFSLVAGVEESVVRDVLERFKGES